MNLKWNFFIFILEGEGQRLARDKAEVVQRLARSLFTLAIRRLGGFTLTESNSFFFFFHFVSFFVCVFFW